MCKSFLKTAQEKWRVCVDDAPSMSRRDGLFLSRHPNWKYINKIKNKSETLITFIIESRWVGGMKSVLSVPWKVFWPSGWIELAHTVSPSLSRHPSLLSSLPPALHYLLLTPDSASHQPRHQYWVLFIVAALFPRLKQYSLTVAIDFSGLCSGKHSFKPLLLY